MKKRYALILLLLVVLCTALLVACECKHKYSEWSVTTAATCETAGERTRTCSKCGKTERETIPAGHTLMDVPEVPKTCEADGVLAHSHCEACGADFIDGEQKTVEELKIPCTGHDILQVNALTATCHTNGVAAHLHCARCGINYVRGEVRTDAELVIPSTHSTIEIPGAKNSCLGDGVRPHVYCYDCGANFIDDEEVSEEDVRIPASHNLVKVPAVAKTCTADGRLAYEHCRICDGNFVDGEKKTPEDLRVPAGHDYGTLIENSGERPHYHCEACDKKFDEAHHEITVLALPAGHIFGAWTEQVDATCDTDGTKGYYTCSDPDCAGTYFDIDYRVIGTTADSLKIPAAHHYEYVIDETYHGEVCSECGSVQNREGHHMQGTIRVTDGYVYCDYVCMTEACGYERTEVMGPALTDLWVERAYIVGRDNGVTFHIYRGTAQGNDGHGSMNQYMVSPDFNEYVTELEKLPASAFPVTKSFEFTALEGFKKTIEITFDVERVIAYPEHPVYQKGALKSLGELSVTFYSNYDGNLGETTLADCTVTDDGGFAVDADLAGGAKNYTVKFTYNDTPYEITFTYVGEETAVQIFPEAEELTVVRGRYPLIRVLFTAGNEEGITESYLPLMEFDFLDGTSYDPDLLGEQTVTIGIGEYARYTMTIHVVDPMMVTDVKPNIVCPIGSEYLRVRVRYQDGTYGYEIITPRMILDVDPHEGNKPLDLTRAGEYAVVFVIRGEIFFADVTVYDPNHLNIVSVSTREFETLVWEYETDADGGYTVIKDTTGLYLHIVYDDESEAIVPMTADMLTFDPDEVKAVQEGRRAIITVTVTYQGKTRQLRVRLAAKTPASIDGIVAEGDETWKLLACGDKLYRRYMLRVNCEGGGVTYVPLTTDMLYLITRDEQGNEQVAATPVDLAQLESGRYSVRVRYGECETTMELTRFTEDDIRQELTGYGIDIQYIVCGDRDTVLKRLSGLSFHYRLYVRLDGKSTSLSDEEVLGFEDLTIGDLSDIDFTKPGNIIIPLSFGEATYSLYLSLIPDLDLYAGKAYTVPYWSETMAIILYENGYYHLMGKWLDRVDQYECVDTVNGVLSLGTGEGLFTIGPDGKRLTPWSGMRFAEKYGLTPTLYMLEDMQVRLYTNGTVTYLDLYDDDEGEWVYSITFIAEMLPDGTVRVNGLRYAADSNGVLTAVIEGKTLYSYTETVNASAKLEFLFNEEGRAYMQEYMLDSKTGETLGVRTYVYEWRMTGDVIDLMYNGQVAVQFKVAGNALTPIGDIFG